MALSADLPDSVPGRLPQAPLPGHVGLAAQPGVVAQGDQQLLPVTVRLADHLCVRQNNAVKWETKVSLHMCNYVRTERVKECLCATMCKPKECLCATMCKPKECLCAPMCKPKECLCATMCEPKMCSMCNYVQYVTGIKYGCLQDN